MSVADWTPTVEEIGAVLRARTKDDVGNELGTFTTATRPTAVQVAELIAQAVGEVRDEHGDPDRGDNRDPSQAYNALKREAILTTAMQVELTYFPEQVTAGRSPYPALVVQRDRAAVIAGKAVQELASGGEVGEADDGRLPVWNFPIQGNGMVGWGTRW